MTLFWIVSAILILLSIVLIGIPIIRKKANNDDLLRDELNKALYQDRLSELAEETQGGIVANQQELVDDLKQSLLDDVPHQQRANPQSSISPLAILLPSVVFVVVLSYALYFKFGAWSQVEQWQQVSANLPALSKKLITPEGGALSDDEMRDLTLALRTRLHYHPDDSTGWLLLGRIALADRNVTTAIGAMKKAYMLKPDDDDIKLGYAQALMLSQDELDQTTARRVLGDLVQNDHVDLRVFSLLAFDAYEREDYTGAVRYWRVMQRMIGPADSRYEMLSRSIDNAQQQLGGDENSGKSVSVSISLSDKVKVDKKSALIVSVHTADGSPMPVAAARYPLGSFPRTVVLDDTNSMLQNRKLSSLESLMVRVRLDKDGNVATKQGDWFGESEAVKMGQSVSVTIDKIYQ
ncbi:c-type cytochrome biogenesis protein CcmI [Vibrio pectenicida]|uniref:C-type cytochrome biogenesis protein CcmI n=1 Tax=Vibrio pectenicida TaxID=62763 RepID=A0A3R9L379_9VIBR|nr:c-type cytochrome biogenesis protein CcmI [Vibrio pectenicida]RSD31990.1 c-type cytochrome biogenesis protein CcmI [Vibrio pectenicida]